MSYGVVSADVDEAVGITAISALDESIQKIESASVPSGPVVPFLIF